MNNDLRLYIKDRLDEVYDNIGANMMYSDIWEFRQYCKTFGALFVWKIELHRE